jgi:hypothetical protein
MFSRASIPALFRGPSGRLLVVESDDLATRAAVLQTSPQGGTQIEACAESTAPDLAAALAETLRAIRAAGVRMPVQALMLSPHVHVMTLQLPIDPAKTPPRAHMQELLRWELEPYMARSPLPHDPDETTVCGWTALEGAPAAGRWPWRVAGMTDSYRRHLVDQFGRNGLRLRAMYPLVGHPEPPETDAARSALRARLQDAADHFLGRVPPNRAVGVPALEPLPPLHQDWRFRATVALAVAALALGGAAVGFRAGQRQAAAVLESSNVQRQREKEVAALRTRLDDQARQAEFLQQALPQRAILIPRVLQALEVSCPEEILLTAVAETAAGEIEVRGWGLTPQAIQAFKIDLQSHVDGWKVVDTAQSLKPQRGWGGLSGYPFDLKLAAAGPSGPGAPRP